jgi:hypothetical protein
VRTNGSPIVFLAPQSMPIRSGRPVPFQVRMNQG